MVLFDWIRFEMYIFVSFRFVSFWVLPVVGIVEVAVDARAYAGIRAMVVCSLACSFQHFEH